MHLPKKEARADIRCIGGLGCGRESEDTSLHILRGRYEYIVDFRVEAAVAEQSAAGRPLTLPPLRCRSGASMSRAAELSVRRYSEGAALSFSH